MSARVLLLDELLLKIFYFFDTYKDQQRFLLLNKATCRVATGEMWRTVVSAKRLEAILPRELRLFHTELRTLRDVCLSRPLSKQEIDRILLYTSCIQEIAFVEDKDTGERADRVTPFSRPLLILSTIRHPKSLFPELRTLDLTIFRPSAYVAALFLLAQRPQHLTITTFWEGPPEVEKQTPFVDELVSAIVSYSSQLLSLSIHPPEDWDPPISSSFWEEERYSSLIRGLHAARAPLTKLDVRPIYRGKLLLAEIADFPSLADLILDCDEISAFDPQDLNYTPLSLTPFQHLTSLTVAAQQSQLDVTPLLESITSTRLERLNLFLVYPKLGVPELTELNRVIASKWYKTLLAYDLKSDLPKMIARKQPPDAQVPAHGGPFSCLEPLLACEELEDFQCSFPFRIAYSNWNIRQLALAMPKLQRLWLTCQKPKQMEKHKPAGTTESLYTLASHCSCLEDLSLDIDFTTHQAADLQKEGRGSVTLFSTRPTEWATLEAVRDVIWKPFPLLDTAFMAYDAGGWESGIWAISSTKRRDLKERFSGLSVD